MEHRRCSPEDDFSSTGTPSLWRGMPRRFYEQLATCFVMQWIFLPKLQEPRPHLSSGLRDRAHTDKNLASGVHWMYKRPSHAAELTAGYYNANNNQPQLAQTSVWTSAPTTQSPTNCCRPPPPPLLSCAHLHRYSRLARLFKSFDVYFDFTCMEMTDASQPTDAFSGPQELVFQVITATASDDSMSRVHMRQHI